MFYAKAVRTDQAKYAQPDLEKMLKMRSFWYIQKYGHN